MKNQITNEDALNALIAGPYVNTAVISDGYHTFGDLYQHRVALFKALCRVLAESHPYEIWRSRRHSDYSMIEGWFVLGINKGRGEQITYHLPESEWGTCDFAQPMDVAPEWDGHTADDVVTRLNTLI